VAACPVGAISPEGRFNFSACLTTTTANSGRLHPLGEQIADSKNALDYRRRVSDSESASMWQSLGFGPNYKAAYCMSVCPAGRTYWPLSHDRPGHLRDVGASLAGQGRDHLRRGRPDAEDHVPGVSRTSRSSRSATAGDPDIPRFLSGLQLTFQPGKAANLNAVYHFHFHRARNRNRQPVTIRGRD